tara:strand:+ start:29 stop:376 length:348 start_codon:yes stop_codon:yes gene_type:complete
MNKFYDQRTSSSPEQEAPIAQLTIYADEEGLIYFACDWEDNPTALSSIADIFYKLDRKNLITEILQDLRTQCVLENKEDTFEEMVTIINNSISIEGSDLNQRDNVAVSPKNVTRL